MPWSPPQMLFTAAQMAQVDRETIAAGTPGAVLMERAGRAVARMICSWKGRGRANIVCGPGNNGGDGYVIARLLRDAGWNVGVWAFGDPSKLSGDAALMFKKYVGDVKPLREVSPDQIDFPDVGVDALFGTGLSKPIAPEIYQRVRALINMAGAKIAVDIPSGVSSDSGQLLAEHMIHFDDTVTFGAKKLGHLLEPARRYCGTLWVADIGLTATAHRQVWADVLENKPHCEWLTPAISMPASSFSLKAAEHKYQRGHVAVIGGIAEKAGASLLAATAALRTGAGLVTHIGRSREVVVQGAPLALMRGFYDVPKDLPELLADPRLTCIVIGPGLGLDDFARDSLDIVFGLECRKILDADAITLIAKHAWMDRLDESCTLTPHDGEFARLFPYVAGNKVERVRQAVAQSGATIVLKGADSVIASPLSPYAYINAQAPPYLATAGSGDVLAGIIGALAQNDPQLAACAGVYLHSLCGQVAGHALIADDLLKALPQARLKLLEEIAESAFS